MIKYYMVALMRLKEEALNMTGGIPAWLSIDIYTFVIAGLILFFDSTWRMNKDKRNTMFLLMTALVMVLTVFDAFGRLDGLPDSAVASTLAKVGNYVLFAFDPLYFAVALYYESSWMIAGRNDFKVFRLVVYVIAAVNFVVVTVSSVFDLKLFYYFDNNMEYIRGPLFMFRAVLLIAMLFVGVLYVINRREDIPPKHRAALISFPLMVSVGSIIQSLTSDLPLEYASTVMASLVLFVYLQSRDMTEDFLTGSMNRRSLDSELEERIAAAANGQSFSAIMIDVDFFKDINDTFGHATGDDALRDVFSILNSCLRDDDRIARYGGDEFFVITPISEREYLEKCARRIRNRLWDFNDQSERPYKLSLSLGFDIYDHEAYPTAAKFIKHLDDLMYAEKELHHNELGKETRHGEL